MSKLPYFITEESPQRLRNLLIKNPFLPTLYENIRTKRALNYSIKSLDDDDPLADFIVLELSRHELVEKVGDKFEVKYSRIVPPRHWKPFEHRSYIENVLSYTRDLVMKEPEKKVTFGNWVGAASLEDFLAFGEKQLSNGDSLIDKPDGPIKFQFTFILTEISCQDEENP